MCETTAARTQAQWPRHLLGIVLLAVAPLLALPVLAAEAVETRPLSGGFTAVQLEGPIDVVLSQGETAGIRIQGKAEDVARVKIEVKDQRLIIGMGNKSGWFSSWVINTPLVATLALPKLTQLTILGSGNARLGRFDLKDDQLSIDIRGSGDVIADHLLAKSVRLNIQGSGDVTLAGTVDTQAIAIAGSGDYLAGNLKSRQGAVSISGSGDAELWSEESLSVSIAGSGDVSYYGQPRLTRSVNGSGDVISLGSK